MDSTIPPYKLRELARNWLLEDTPSFDIGGAVVGDAKVKAAVLCKSPGVLAGVPFFDAIFNELGCFVEWRYDEGTNLDPICQIATIHGNTRAVLLGERVALNCLARASGVATLTTRFQKIVAGQKWAGKIAGTRKTTPGFRLVEKYALLVAKADTHRFDLSSMVMLKDNHLASFGGNIAEAVKKAKTLAGHFIKIEVECSNHDEALAAASTDCDIIMLDNFNPEAAKETAKELKSVYPKLLIEVSGGINEDTIANYCSPYIDIISCGKLTQGYPTIDFSVDLL